MFLPLTPGVHYFTFVGVEFQLPCQGPAVQAVKVTVEVKAVTFLFGGAAVAQ